MLPVRDLSHPEPLDLEAMKRNQIRRFMDGMPEYIKRMTVDECRKEAARLAAERPQFPGKDWLNKLKSRIADGENVPFRSRQIVEEMTRRVNETD